MHRKLLFGAAFFFAGINVSSAADVPDMPATYDSDWTGLYATLSAGYSSIKIEGEDVDIERRKDQDTSGGAIFGLGVGYDFDLGDVVLGLEVDASLPTNDSSLEMKNTVDVDYDWFATGRVRAGYDFDGTLLYATGGVAALNANFNDDQGFSGSKTFTGWTAGGGVEHMITDSISLRIEGLYADFSSEDLDDLDLETKIDPELWLVRGGVSFRF